MNSSKASHAPADRSSLPVRIKLKTWHSEREKDVIAAPTLFSDTILPSRHTNSGSDNCFKTKPVRLRTCSGEYIPLKFHSSYPLALPLVYMPVVVALCAVGAGTRATTRPRDRHSYMEFTA
jgi:hypothetical protein